jgi:hypothetical protein
MSDMNDIKLSFPKIDFLAQDYSPLSSACNQLIVIKDDIFKINQKHMNNINSLVYNIGNAERTKDPNKRNNFINEIPKNIQFYNTKDMESLKPPGSKISAIDYIKSILTNTYITFNLYELNNEFFIEKKKSKTEKIYIKMINTHLIQTGNLSISLILKTTYIYKIGDAYKMKNVCLKVYPFDIFKNEPYATNISTNNMNDLNVLSKYITIREGLVGCWINTHLLNKNLFAHPITNTIMAVSDLFFANGKNLNVGADPTVKNSLPFTYDQMVLQNKNWTKIKGEFGKNWVNNFLESKALWKTVAYKQFGYIEMEPVDYTLDELIKKKLFSLDLFFECLYTKLCLQVIGNVETPDDHINNIMTSLCLNVRKYTIKSRDKEYIFYIDDINKIKFIDLERTTILKNRNIFSQNTAFYSYIYEYKDGTSNTVDKDYIKIIYDEIWEKKLELDRFCEFMNKVLPEKYTDGSLYVDKQIEEYYLDLDIDESRLIPNMLFTPRSTDILREKHYKSWSGRLEF